MKPTQIMKLIKELRKKDSRIILKMEIADAVEGNVCISEMTEKQINSICTKMMNFYLKQDHGESVDFYEWAYRIQQSLDDGNFKSITPACLNSTYYASLGY